MKESYHFNPTILSKHEIEEYCRGCVDKRNGLRLLISILAEESESLEKKIQIHKKNYATVRAMLIEDGTEK